jgi:N-methylhydantoinase B
MTMGVDQDYDVITAEVVNMAMQAIVLEMGITIERTSGQPAATDAKDYSCVICRADGGSVAYYGNNLQHLGDSLTGTQSIVQRFPAETIRPGDAFIYNDPFSTGALHQADVAVQAPVFHGGRIVAWFFSNIHHADIGGMTAAGFCPESRDVYGEGLRMAPIKLVDAGVLNEPVMSLIETNVRTPIVLGDIRSQLASINVGQQRLLEVIAEHGVGEWERYLEVNERLLSDLLAKRIGALPKGVYTAQDWVEYDAFGGERYVPIQCALEVTDDARLVFDYAGSGPQMPGYVNGSRGAMLGSVMAVVLAALLPDFDVNAGAYERLEVKVGESGTITNPQAPAGMSGGHMDCGPRSMRAAHAALSKAMALSEDEWIRGRTYALGGVTAAVPVLTGHRLTGDWGFGFMLDQQSTGHGALPTGDGVAFGGIDYSIAGREPDVETAEEAGPLLYLWRREIPDSGGAGAYRGGNSLETMFVPWKVDHAELAHSSPGGVIPTRGVRGGYPGGTTRVEVYRDAIAEQASKLPGPSDIDGKPDAVPSKCAVFELGVRDGIRQLIASGAGWGDPLLRPFEDIERDLASGSTTAAATREAYGVVVDADGVIDRAASERRRREIRRQRIGGEPAPIADPTRRGAVRARDGRLSCSFCEADLGEAADGIATLGHERRHALAPRLAQMRIPIQASRSESFALVERCCPSCATLLDVEVAR